MFGTIPLQTQLVFREYPGHTRMCSTGMVGTVGTIRDEDTRCTSGDLEPKATVIDGIMRPQTATDDYIQKDTRRHCR